MSLVLEKKYESITVQEILDRADVGRSTFYTHFQDKDELLRDGLHYLNGFLRSEHAASTGMPGKPCEGIVDFGLPLFEHANAYRAVIRALLGSTAETVVRQHIQSLVVSIVSQRVKAETQRHKRVRGQISAELLTHFLVSTYVSALMWWLGSKNPLPPKEIDAAYRQFVLPCLASIFG